MYVPFTQQSDRSVDSSELRVLVRVFGTFVGPTSVSTEVLDEIDLSNSHRLFRLLVFDGTKATTLCLLVKNSSV